MKNSPNGHSTPQPALIFIPDISGFTQFVTETEISHSKHIIEELLEIIIDANRIKLEVSEIEGDAILFYRFGQAPSADELLNQVREMFSNFHLHLKQYETRRVCNCGACRTAHNLSIKFIAHYGEIMMNSVHQYKKLFGKEVIVAHRLLKNDIDHHEYSLFTDSLMIANESWKSMEEKTWSPMQQSEKNYDSGLISFSYLSLDPLIHQLPDIHTIDYGLPGKKTVVLEVQTYIDAPIETVFNVVADVAWRTKWIPGLLPEVTDINSPITHSGQTHRCIADDPLIIGHDYKISDGMVTFCETAEKKTHAVMYILKQEADGRTFIKASMVIPANPVKALMFKLIMKKKMLKIFDLAWSNLNQYCSGLASRGENHPYSVQLQFEEMTLNA